MPADVEKPSAQGRDGPCGYEDRTGRPSLILSLGLLIAAGMFIEHLLYSWSVIVARNTKNKIQTQALPLPQELAARGMWGNVYSVERRKKRVNQSRNPARDSGRRRTP